ncbi:hypothetical protein BDZ94DRAFT_1312978 [Collybia nuda]|uniref:RNA-binding domain-containing protein n=1 Tax=Collybia nuda TaxID=64659 RepID=A0A9P5XZU8_9AGAR|nr:hypothetical protein BDZ94DRAFT_1312978 [Collybia nuda]
MAPTSIEGDDPATQQDNWGPQDDQSMGPGGGTEPSNGAPLHIDDDRAAGQGMDNPEFPRGSSVGDVSVSDSKGDTFLSCPARLKRTSAYHSMLDWTSFVTSGGYSGLGSPPSSAVSCVSTGCLLSAVQPNKVYVGGLPEHTQQEDLQSCFGKIGNITNIELKIGYGFVEFDSREAAEESVAKYHEGFFMGNKIRVEMSHGGGRTAKYSGDPGACFKCGQMGHWARECPNHTGISRRSYDPPLIDRIQRDYQSAPPRNMPPRDEMGPPGRFQPRDNRYEHPSVAPPREFRRPPSPRDFREYHATPPSVRGREYYDDRRGPLLPMTERDRYQHSMPPADYRGRYPPPSDPPYRSYGGPPPGPPPPAFYDRYERRSSERYITPYPTHGRPRTPPRIREDFDRLPSTRDFEFRGRPPSPPRYIGDYSPRISGTDLPPSGRYRRRSESPQRPYDQAYANSGGYGNGYSGSVSTGPSMSGPPRGGGPPPRDYVHPRNGRDPIDSGPGYRRH